MKPAHKRGARPTLRSVLGRGHLSVALLAVGLAGVSLTLLGVLALRVYANHNLHLIARSISYTVEAAVVFDDSAAANEALALIASAEEVAEARVFDNEGQQLAHWQRSDSGLLARLEGQVASALLDEPVNLPITHQQRQVGRIELVGQGRSLLLFLLSGLAGILFCTLLSALAAQHLSRRLLGDIVRPARAWPVSPMPPAGSAASIGVYRRQRLPSSMNWAMTSTPCSTNWRCGTATCRTKTRRWPTRPAMTA